MNTCRLKNTGKPWVKSQTRRSNNVQLSKEIKELKQQLNYLSGTQREIVQIFENFVQSSKEDGSKTTVDKEIIKNTISAIPRAGKTQDIGTFSIS